MPVQVPAAFAVIVLNREGEAGRGWLSSLSCLLDTLLQRWGCVVDGRVRHGNVGIVVPVRQGRRPAVLKISFPHPGNVGEWTALEAFAGRGAVRLYDVVPEQFAMLLERAHSRDLSILEDTETALTIAGQVARELAVPATAETPRLAELVRSWATDLLELHRREASDSRLPSAVVEAAAGTFRELAGDDTETLIHGDLHFSNVLRAGRVPWLAIDPKGLAGTPCFDAATVVRHQLLDLVRDPGLPAHLARRVGLFCDAASIDLELALRCTQARFVTSYYWELAHRSPSTLVDAMRAAAIASTSCMR